MVGFSSPSSLYVGIIPCLTKLYNCLWRFFVSK
jgi:hypothetical protein